MIAERQSPIAPTETRGRLLLVDDDRGFLRLLSIRLERSGYDVVAVENGRDALRAVSDRRPDVVISDLRMEGMDGLGLLDALQRQYLGLPIIILTAHGTIPDAVTATQGGAVAFVTKPVDKAELMRSIDKAMRLGGTADDSDDWRSAIVTVSPSMEELLAEAYRVAQSAATVLIKGASGCGKELLASAIHKASPQRDRPFVAVNCGAIPENLLESELFGHLKGAFTGADRDREGLFAAANGGTLFLDEIGDMPLALQVKLLRVLEERRVRPVGGTDAREVNVRVISATHRDLYEAIRRREFREDLYYRLNVVQLYLPPLSARREDIPVLVNHFLARLAERDSSHRVYSPEAMELLAAAEWPGNVRQLANVVEQNVTLSPAPVISAALVRRALGESPGGEQLPSLTEARDEFVRSYLVQLLKITGGRVGPAARLAQRNRTEFYKLLSRNSIDPASYKVDA